MTSTQIGSDRTSSDDEMTSNPPERRNGHKLAGNTKRALAGVRDQASAPAKVVGPKVVEPKVVEPEAAETETVDLPVAEDVAVDEVATDDELRPVVPTPRADRSGGGSLARTMLTGKGLAISILSLLLAAAVALSVVLWLKVNDVTHERNVARASNLSPTVQNQILERARKVTVDLTTYDYRNLAAQQSALAGESTPAFLARVAKSKDTLNSLFNSLKATAKGTIVDAAVKSVTGDTAVVLVFVNQSASNKETKTPATQYTRLRVTLKLVGGVWMLDSVDPV